MSASVRVPHPESAVTGNQVMASTEAYLRRCKLAPNTVKAYLRQCSAYLSWVTQHREDPADVFADVVGAESAVASWRRDLIASRRSPATVNQALAAVTLLYEHGAGIRIHVKRARVDKPGEPDALTTKEQSKLERSADRHGQRDAALIFVLLYSGARAEECARLECADIAITARTGQVRLHGKGDEVRTVPLPAPARQRLSAWLVQRGTDPGPLWPGQRGRLTTSGLAQVVIAIGEDAGLTGLRPHRLRHTYATRLRQGGADPAQVQALLGHSSLDTTARYFRAGKAERAEVIERIFER